MDTPVMNISGQSPNNTRPGAPAERTLDALHRDYILIGKKRVRSWTAWLIIGLSAGLAIGIIFVANRSEEFDRSGIVSAIFG